MKICAIICEFNPFHNGHKYLIERVRQSGGYDGVLCIMSGHFTQRGDMAILDKFTRARHAVPGGADCVIELPAPFAVAPAPVFAGGAVKLAASIPDVCALAFGCEEVLDFKGIARAVAGEDGRFKAGLNRGLENGESYAKSYAAALESVCGTAISSPNNILALEYAKAILKYRPDMAIMPVKREGAGYNDDTLGGTYASASAIRAHLCEAEIGQFVPPFVAADLASLSDSDGRWEAIVKYALCSAPVDRFEKLYGGGEGLGNRLKGLERLPLEEIIAQATTKRYPSARIRRVLTANALNLTATDGNAYLKKAGYLKPLAVRADMANEFLKALSVSPFPLVITGRDVEKLKGPNAALYASSRFADDVWCAASDRDIYDCTIVKV